MNNFPVAKESFPFLVISGIAALLLGRFHPWLSLVAGAVFLFSAYFFRNPPRRVTCDEGAAISPADGVVMSVTKVWEREFLQSEVWKVTIFLNIFNVHINRTPVAGKVEEIKYIPGKFLPAFKSHASEINERNFVLINTGKARILVCQITGFIARRIVCWTKKGDCLLQGERFGLIRFGSCTELYLPLEYSITVEKGTKVKSGVTTIGRWCR